MDLHKELDDFEALVKELKHLYELYFAGEIHIEPQRERQAIRRLILKLNNQHMTNTGLKFRFISLQGTFNSYQRLWDRILLEIELGTYKPHRAQADRHVGKIDSSTGAIVESPEHQALMRKQHGEPPADGGLRGVEKLYTEFLAARQATKEAGKVSLESFRKSLEKQLPNLQARLGANIRFRVAVEDGKAKVKGVKG